jgi:hypothetical protein
MDVVREFIKSYGRNYKRPWWARWELEAESLSLFRCCLKT